MPANYAHKGFELALWQFLKSFIRCLFHLFSITCAGLSPQERFPSILFYGLQSFSALSRKNAHGYRENLPQEGFHSQEPFLAHLLPLPSLGNGKQERISHGGITSEYDQWFVYFHGLFLLLVRSSDLSQFDPQAVVAKD